MQQNDVAFFFLFNCALMRTKVQSQKLKFFQHALFKEGVMNLERKKGVQMTNGAYVETYAYNPLFQGLQFKDPDGNLFDGELSKVFDINDNVPNDADYDPQTSITGIFRFKDGYLHAEGVPAVEYPGHSEFWQNGKLLTVNAGYDSVREEWLDGMLVAIDMQNFDFDKS